MTLTQIASFINQAIRNKLTPDQLVLILDAVQKLGFDENMQAFQVWTETLTTYDTLSFAASGYTNAVVGDIGKIVVVATSGATGTLIAYDNTAKTWRIQTADDFYAGEAVSITTGTGAGTTAATDWQLGYIGPYSFPTDPPVRKMWGVTGVTDRAIFGVDPVYIADADDYGAILDTYMDSRLLKPGRVDDIGETFTFANGPSHSSEFRWVYWRGAPDITGIATEDDADLLIPSRYHFNYVQACIKCARMTINGESFSREDVEADLGPWWESLRKPYTPNGKARKLTSNKSPGWM
jgi:hypothetical protein